MRRLSRTVFIVLGSCTLVAVACVKAPQEAATGSAAAIKLARKEAVETHDKINNGRKDVPAILLQPIVVDKSNVDATVVKDGYHTRQEIYGSN